MFFWKPSQILPTGREPNSSLLKVQIPAIHYPARFSTMAFSYALSFRSFSHITSSQLFVNKRSLYPLNSMSFSSKTPLHLTSNVNFIHGRNTHLHNQNNRRSIFNIRASGSISSPNSSSGTSLVLVSSAITVTFAVANRVLYKLALVPMKDYPFFLAQFTTFGYFVSLKLI